MNSNNRKQILVSDKYAFILSYEGSYFNFTCRQIFLSAVPFKSMLGGGGRRNGRFFEGGGGEGSNSELRYPIRLHMISGRRVGGLPNF